jgi:GT2 family glycosyltransferase
LLQLGSAPFALQTHFAAEQRRSSFPEPSRLAAERNGEAPSGHDRSRLLFPDGTIQHCGVVFGAGAVGPYHLHRRQPAHTLSRSACEYQAVTGACMLVDGEVFRSLQGLDESYPFGLEDIDFCLRVRQSGRRIYCMNDTESLHFESMTEGRVGLDIPSRRLFMDRWAGKYAIDG